MNGADVLGRHRLIRLFLSDVGVWLENLPSGVVLLNYLSFHCLRCIVIVLFLDLFYLADFLFFHVSKVAQQHPFGAVDQAVVAELELADFALIEGAVSHVEALVALILDLTV